MGCRSRRPYLSEPPCIVTTIRVYTDDNTVMLAAAASGTLASNNRRNRVYARNTSHVRNDQQNWHSARHLHAATQAVCTV